MNLTQAVSKSSILYPDSEISFDYITEPALGFGETSIKLESARFGNDAGTGSFWVPENSRPVDARVISYSGAYWTDNLKISNSGTGLWSQVFDLSSYTSTDYESLGDPYAIEIPVELITEGMNYVDLGCGVGPGSGDVGNSREDKVIYTIAAKPFTGYSEPLRNKEGCLWTVEFYDGSTIDLSVPATYSGIKQCSYTSLTYTLGAYDNESSADASAYALFRQLDSDPVDGRLDIIFNPRDIESVTTSVGGIRSMWGPVRVKLEVWM